MFFSFTVVSMKTSCCFVLPIEEFHAFLDSFDHAIKQQTNVDWVDQKSMKIAENAVHPSGSDNSATYPSMINYGKNCAILTWSQYMITDGVHQGMNPVLPDNL